MGFHVRNVAFDCADPYALAQFWSQVMHTPLSEDDSPGDPVATIALPQGFTLYFAKVPESKVAKNRLHLCLTPDIPRDTEVERMLALGAAIVDDRRADPDDGGWVVFADPQGNEFCVLEGHADPQHQ